MSPIFMSVFATGAPGSSGTYSTAADESVVSEQFEASVPVPAELPPQAARLTAMTAVMMTAKSFFLISYLLI